MYVFITGLHGFSILRQLFLCFQVHGQESSLSSNSVSHQIYANVVGAYQWEYEQDNRLLILLWILGCQQVAIVLVLKNTDRCQIMIRSYVVPHQSRLLLTTWQTRFFMYDFTCLEPFSHTAISVQKVFWYPKKSCLSGAT